MRKYYFTYLIILSGLSIFNLSCEEKVVYDKTDKDVVNTNSKIEETIKSIDDNIDSIKNLPSIDLSKYGINDSNIHSDDYSINNSNLRPANSGEIEILEKSIDKSNN